MTKCFISPRVKSENDALLLNLVIVFRVSLKSIVNE
jgi:hypothetical protein